MKNKLTIVGLCMLLTLSINSCMENEPEFVEKISNEPLQERSLNQDEIKNEEANLDNFRVSSITCGSGASGSYNGTGYYVYSDRILSFAGMSSSCQITVYVSAYTVPNKFVIKDSNNNNVASSDWLGQASYGGPYGPSLNNSGNQTLTFTKGSSNTFKLQVYTMAPYPPYTLREDVWNVSISCNNCTTPTCNDGIQNGNETGVDCGGSCTDCPTCNDGIMNGDETGVDCGGTCGSCCACPTTGYYDSYNGTGYYQYPNKIINVSDVNQGCTIRLRVDALDVPNYFTVKDGNGNTVASSGWNGIASYPGPYGQSLNTPASEYLTFQKGNFNSYTLQVVTMAPYPPYQQRVDEWYVTKSCQE